MKLEQSFQVEAPVEEVWAALVDVERIAPCLPGAEITEAGEDGTYRGNFQVRLGPTTAAYRGTLRMESLDEQARVATMSANGQDKRGQGSAKATIVSRMIEEGGGTRVDVETDFTITGKLARFGRSGMIKDISQRLLRDFAACLQEEIEARPAAAGAVEAEAGAGPTAAAGAGAAGTPPQAAGPEGGAGTSPVAPPAAVTVPAAGAAAVGADGAESQAAARPPAARPSAPARREAKPVQGFSLFVSVLWERVRRLVGRLRGRRSG